MIEERKLVAFQLGIETEKELAELAVLLDRSKASCMREAIKRFIRENQPIVSRIE